MSRTAASGRAGRPYQHHDHTRQPTQGRHADTQDTGPDSNASASLAQGWPRRWRSDARYRQPERSRRNGQRPSRLVFENGPGRQPGHEDGELRHQGQQISNLGMADRDPPQRQHQQECQHRPLPERMEQRKHEMPPGRLREVIEDAHGSLLFRLQGHLPLRLLNDLPDLCQFVGIELRAVEQRLQRPCRAAAEDVAQQLAHHRPQAPAPASPTGGRRALWPCCACPTRPFFSITCMHREDRRYAYGPSRQERASCTPAPPTARAGPRAPREHRKLHSATVAAFLQTLFRLALCRSGLTVINGRAKSARSRFLQDDHVWIGIQHKPNRGFCSPDSKETPSFFF